ncbi:uncharacterized protein LOC127813622 [Diospyros lotus]|uniref:uncharacterized protein LOC127813622 n=1 Tax=Diospyros lotus TaxID=55363 RepID=UPI0022563D00|nr:uncharacterized protein LOC127813622 [Diospyros lotus]
MASLKSGGLAKLLQDMNADKKISSKDVKKPVLLQIRSIIPMLEEGDFWPNKGFYLKVADLSHAMYVLFPREQDEMILSNRLQLGQFIHVQKLEAAFPVPSLKGVTPVPGRHRCQGAPEDIVPATNLVKFLEASNLEPIKDKGIISEKKTSTVGLSGSEPLTDKSIDVGKGRSQGRLRSLSASRVHSLEQRGGLNCITKRCDDKNRTSDHFDNDTDSDIPKPTRRISKRRSWTEMELLDVKEIFNSSMAKHETVPRACSRSAHVITRRRVVDSSTKSVKSSNRTTTYASKKHEEASYAKAMCSAVNGKEGAESRISWDSLPLSLANLGKDMVRQKDVAVLAAVEALQEACAAEKLIKCLRTYSDFLSVKGDDPQPFVEKFFDLQDNLAQARLMVQSLTNISPTDMKNTGSIKEVLNLAVERKNNATSWIRSAVAFDLSPCPSSPTLTATTAAGNAATRSSTTNRVSKPKVACIVRKQRNDSTNKESQVEWTRGSTFHGAAKLARALQDESRRSFIGYIEKFLDGAESKSFSTNSGSWIAGMMCQMERVNDWLNPVTTEANFESSGCKGSPAMEDSETVLRKGEEQNI